MIKTELIASTKAVKVKDRQMIIVTTTSGAVIWVPQAQFDSASETISYTPRAKGEKYTKSDGKEGTLLQDRNDFVGGAKQIVQKHSAKELLEFVISKGVTPTFSLS